MRMYQSRIVFLLSQSKKQKSRDPAVATRRNVISVARIGVLTPNGFFLTSVWCAKFWVGVFIKEGDFSNIFKYKGETHANFILL